MVELTGNALLLEEGSILGSGWHILIFKQDILHPKPSIGIKIHVSWRKALSPIIVMGYQFEAIQMSMQKQEI